MLWLLSFFFICFIFIKSLIYQKYFFLPILIEAGDLVLSSYLQNYGMCSSLSSRMHACCSIGSWFLFTFVLWWWSSSSVVCFVSFSNMIIDIYFHFLHKFQVDIPIKYLGFFLEDDAELEHIKQVRYASLVDLVLSSSENMHCFVHIPKFSYLIWIITAWTNYVIAQLSCSGIWCWTYVYRWGEEAPYRSFDWNSRNTP